MKLSEIKEKGYSLKSDSFSIEEIQEYNKLTRDWGEYHLWDIELREKICKITAKNGAAAIRAFHKLYNLGEMFYDIFHAKTSYKSVFNAQFTECPICGDTHYCIHQDD